MNTETSMGINIGSGSGSGSSSGIDDTLPYNPNNYVVDSDDVLGLLNKYGFLISEIKDLAIFRNAFVHKSYCTRKNENFLNGNLKRPDSCIPLQEESNERLEFLGDAVLNLVSAKYLFARYPNENEGYMTKIRTKLVNGTMLAFLANALNLNKFVIISKQIEEGHGRNNKKILEDCFEAFLGAIILNTDFDTTYTWLVNVFENEIDFSELLSSNSNHKDVLLKYFQHNFNIVPTFLEMSTDTNHSGSKSYRVCLKHKGNIVGVGYGCNKKQAENDCSKNALLYYGQSIV